MANLGKVLLTSYIAVPQFIMPQQLDSQFCSFGLFKQAILFKYIKLE